MDVAGEQVQPGKADVSHRNRFDVVWRASLASSKISTCPPHECRDTRFLWCAPNLACRGIPILLFMYTAFMSSSRLSRRRDPWLTRQIVADMLNVDISKVRRMQRSGELTSVIDERGVHRFRRETVFAMAIARGRVIHGIVAPPGVATAIARQAFEMFDRGKTWRDVVIALQQTVGVAHALCDAYFEAKVFEAQKRRAEEGGDATSDDAAPEADDSFAAFQREQVEEWRRAQAAFEREQQSAEMAQRQRRAAVDRQLRELLAHLPGGGAARARNGMSADDIARLRAWLTHNSEL